MTRRGRTALHFELLLKKIIQSDDI